MRTPLVVFSRQRWGHVRSRTQHLAARLAEHYRVLFVEQPVRGIGPARLERIAGSGGAVEVLCPRLPSDGGDAPAAAQRARLEALLAEHLRREGIAAADCIAWCDTPLGLPLALALSPALLVQDCVDDPAVPAEGAEADLAAAADLVLADGPERCAALRARRPDVRCLPSATEAERYEPRRLARMSEPGRAAAQLSMHLPRPRLGCWFGRLDGSLDLGLVEALATHEPSWQFVMAGPIDGIAASRLPRAPNLHWLGRQPPERLPHLVQQWDACLLPLSTGGSGDASARVLEGLASEKPVIASLGPALAPLYRDAIELVEPGDVDAWQAACRRALSEAPEDRATRVAVARGLVATSSWEATAARVHAWIEAALDEGRVRGVAAPTDVAETGAGAPLALWFASREQGRAKGAQPAREATWSR